MEDVDMEGVATPLSCSSIGEAVSGRGRESVTLEEDEDEDLYYIPERRPSLDLGPTPMDTNNWHFVDQASPPAFGYWSMTSEESSARMDDGDGSSTRVQLNRADSFSSCYSYDSDDCEKKTPKAKSQDDAAEGPSDTPELIRDPNEIKHPSLTVPFTFKALCTALGMLCRSEIKEFKMSLWKRYPRSFNIPPHAMDIVDLVDRLIECYDVELSLQITKTLLQELGQKRSVELLQSLCLRNEVRYEVCQILKSKYSKMCDDAGTQGEKRPIDDVFTTLYMTPASDIGPNTEHEVIEIKQQGTEYDESRVITTENIFSPERLERSNKKLVVLVGPAGSGKSMTIKKLVHDWIEERSHQHISFMFPISFRDLKQFNGRSKICLMDLLNELYPPTKKLSDKDYKCDECKMMFIFDGFDEYSDSVDFRDTAGLFDHTDAGTLNVLVVNILRGRLLLRGLFVITTRPQVDRYIPHDTPYSEISLLSFRDADREEFFKKRFQDPDQAARVIAYINSYKTLRIMCHLPLFCHLVADEHERMFKEQGPQAELPRGITYMYTKLLLVLMGPCRRLRAEDLTPEKEIEFLMKLGKVAFNMLEEGKYRISRIDWKESDVSPREAVTNSGLCMQFLIQPYVLFQENVFSFIHPTMQEYMAALYVFLSFTNHGVIFEQNRNQKLKGIFKGQKMAILYKNAVDRSLSAGGKLDIFLRFLFGMAVKHNHHLLQPFCTSSLKWPTFCEDAAALIRKRMKENVDPDRIKNLQRCLEELGVSATEAANTS